MRYLIAILLVSLYACTDSNSTYGFESDVVKTVEDSLSGMLRVSGNVTAHLGTNDITAKATERPQMDVLLTYDFSIGKSEVTCGDFNALMKPATGLKVKCITNMYPATDVTYYDAALYANERSKSEGMDTAYTYVGTQFDHEKHCTNLDGFAFHPEVKAYRLPTEAEWSLVAQSYKKHAGGWTSENSDYTLHEVCNKYDSQTNVCDMIGNAMEWVNDWYGEFLDTTLTNYVGSPDAGMFGMRVVKGGSYKNAASSIHIYNRGDVYPVTCSSHVDYVGFRLAYGSIPDAVWLGSNGHPATSRVVSLINSTAIRSQTGTYKVKLAFRDDLTGNLAYIDYSSGASVVNEIVDNIPVYHPEISPDGKKVAFCTNIEGLSGKSEIYVRDLNTSGTNLVKLDVESAAIPRWRVLENGDTVITYVTDVSNNKDDATFKAASTWQVKFADGKFGKPEKLFDGAYHGGVSEDDRLAVTGARLLRARVAKAGSTVMSDAVDTIWYKNGDEAEQACNASLAKDSSKRTLFLDFGGKTGQAFAETKYAVHERLLIVDSTGALVQSIGAPSGFTFDHSEWASGVRNIAVATLTNVNGAHTKIALINLSKNEIIELAEGDELWHPCLWVKKDFDLNDDLQLNLDSAGVYYREGQDWAHISMGYKMSLLWRYRNDVEILCVGSSRTENSVVVTSITAGFALNTGHSGNDMNASLYVAENYGLNHLNKLKSIVVSLDLDLWHNSTEYTEILIATTPGFVYDASHGFWTSGLPDGFLDAVALSSQYSDVARTIYEPSRGFFSADGSGWGTASVELDSNWHGDAGMQKIEWNIKRLKDFIVKTEPLGVNIVGVIFPQNPGYRNTGSWGRYGPRRSVAKDIMDSLNKFQKQYPHFHVLDENKNGEHDYADDCAVNTDHLSLIGAAKVTGRIDSLLKTLK